MQACSSGENGKDRIRKPVFASHRRIVLFHSPMRVFRRKRYAWMSSECSDVFVRNASVPIRRKRLSRECFDVTCVSIPQTDRIVSTPRCERVPIRMKITLETQLVCPMSVLSRRVRLFPSGENDNRTYRGSWGKI